MDSIEINIIDPLKESRRNNLNNYFNHMCIMTGYEPITTFWDDFTIADKQGESSIRDTYARVFKTWKKDYKFFTELVMILNWKYWYYYDCNNSKFSQIYEELFYLTQEYGYEHLKGNELSYFLSTLD